MIRRLLRVLCIPLFMFLLVSFCYVPFLYLIYWIVAGENMFKHYKEMVDGVFEFIINGKYE